MDTLRFRDIRCFRGEHTAPLAPLTLLIGENSTGKSTFLALTRIAWDLAFSASEPNFNEDPFSLGAYDDIAHYHGGRGKRPKAFAVGVTLGSGRTARKASAGPSLSVRGEFTSSSGQPDLTHLSIGRADVRIEASRVDGVLHFQFATATETHRVTPIHRFRSTTLNVRNAFIWLEPLLLQGLRQGDLFEGLPPKTEAFLPLLEELNDLRRLPSRRRGGLYWTRPLATAPIRSRPKRTYDLLQEARSPEGEHIPMLLARLAGNSPDAWKALESILAAYGKSAGLFQDVVVRRFGRGDSAPFQLRVRLAGQQKEVNIVDVGYGVSQVLPILVEALVETEPTTFLLQQPEVHLHPRAQAALGTFAATLVKERRHRFLIETHSDHVVDRVRLAVRDGVLPKDAVSLLLFVNGESGTKVHCLRLDDAGNIVSPPKHYRDFFLAEELRLLAAEP